MIPPWMKGSKYYDILKKCELVTGNCNDGRDGRSRKKNANNTQSTVTGWNWLSLWEGKTQISLDTRSSTAGCQSCCKYSHTHINNDTTPSLVFCLLSSIDLKVEELFGILLNFVFKVNDSKYSWPMLSHFVKFQKF